MEKFHGWVTITTIINTMMIDEVMIIYQWQSWHHSKSGLLYQVESHQVGRDYLMMNTYWWFWWKWWYHIILSSSFSCNVEFASCWSKAKATSRPGQTMAKFNQLSKREINQRWCSASPSGYIHLQIWGQCDSATCRPGRSKSTHLNHAIFTSVYIQVVIMRSPNMGALKNYEIILGTFHNMGSPILNCPLLNNPWITLKLS